MGLTSGQAPLSPPGMIRGAVARSFLTAGDTAADKGNVFFRKVAAAAFAITVTGVAAVDDDVIRAEVGQQLTDDVINRITGLYHQYDFTRPGQRLGKRFQ